MGAELKPQDLRIDVFGTEFVNQNPAGVRITHIPTGTAVTISGHRSQMKNRDEAIRALTDLVSRLPSRAPAREEDGK